MVSDNWELGLQVDVLFFSVLHSLPLLGDFFDISLFSLVGKA